MINEEIKNKLTKERQDKRRCLDPETTISIIQGFSVTTVFYKVEIKLVI